MTRSLFPPVDNPRTILAAGALVTLLARPRIPFVLTTAEAGGETLIPTSAYYALIGLLSLHIVFMGLRRFLRGDIVTVFWPPLIILAVALLSVFWSILPALSGRHLVQFVAFTVVIMIASSQLTLRSLVIAIGGASLFLVIYSLGYIAAAPNWGIIETHAGPRWRGAFANQNSLGRWASMLFILSAGFLVHSRRRMLPLGCAAIALISIVQTGSAQALGISLGIAALLAVVELTRRSQRREPLVGLITSIVGLLGAGTLLVSRVDLASLLTDALSGRDGLWIATIPKLLDRPLLGYGIGAFWSSGPANEVRREATFPASHAHNTYIDAALQLGIPFGILFALGTLVFLVVLVRVVFQNHANWPLLAVGAFIAAYSLSASMFFGGSFEWWVLFVAIVGHLCRLVTDDGVPADRRVDASTRE